MPRVRSIGGGSAEYVSFDGLWRADGAGQATRGADGEGELGVANIWWTLLHLFFLFRGCDLLIFFSCSLQYFHPDHLSSAEKMKLELKRVRDKFKMSENDCGSARVQGNLLTIHDHRSICY